MKEQNEEKDIDQFVVLNDRRLKDEPRYMKLIPGKHNVIIDEKRYQREATSLVAKIMETLSAGGSLVATKTVVEREDGSYALVDGATSWRACFPLNIPMAVRVFGPFEGGNDYDLEAQLFYVLNEMRTVASDAKIRVHDGRAADLLRRLNKNKDSLLYGQIWSKDSRTGPLSATVACGGLMAFLLPDSQIFGSSASAVLKLLEPALATSAAISKAEEFLCEVVKLHTKPEKWTKNNDGNWYHPTMVLVAALGYTKAKLNGKKLTDKNIKAIQKRLYWATSKSMMDYDRRERIAIIGNHFAANVI